MQYMLTGERWAAPAPLVNAAKRHKGGQPPRLPDRQFFEALLDLGRTGIPLRDLPAEFGAWDAAYNRLRRRVHSGAMRLRGPDGAVRPDLMAALRDHKSAITAILLTVCPGRGLSNKRQCWKCCERRCAGCGRLTGSAFIRNGNACGRDVPDDPVGERW